MHPVVELRRYALHPGTRETLIEVFDEHLIDPQEAVGMQVLGQFRDLDDPDVRPPSLRCIGSAWPARQAVRPPSGTWCRW